MPNLFTGCSFEFQFKEQNDTIEVYDDIGLTVGVEKAFVTVIRYNKSFERYSDKKDELIKIVKSNLCSNLERRVLIDKYDMKIKAFLLFNDRTAVITIYDCN
ncbi:hypothetical protein [Hydrogenimonas thermophila]|uniref:hypothetical protein n=1 Tax=Hydrogenimonas thermophila TaxID=223786 RepID=UPI0011600C7C|nr:hypothetical protein [Hydrogenimonas thermophila]